MKHTKHRNMPFFLYAPNVFEKKTPKLGIFETGNSFSCFRQLYYRQVSCQATEMFCREFPPFGKIFKQDETVRHNVTHTL